MNAADRPVARCLSREQVRRVDRYAIEHWGIPGLVLMENAGRGTADLLCRLGISGPVVVCCGRGNNGGDGLVLARHLDLRGHPVRVILWCQPEELSGDAATNFAILARTDVPIAWFAQGHDARRFEQAAAGAAWLVDALLGTGARGEPRPPYDAAIDAGVELYDYLVQIKQGEPFDYEFSLDEGPGITTPEELRYALDRLTKKGVKVAFIAPNVGFEKRLDYRLPDGMPGLEARVKEMAVIAADYGALLDFHSGSDKSSLTYQTISKAAGGKIKLKVSGKLQLILSEVLADLDPEFFNEWWDYTLISAKAEADAGSSVAVEYVKMVEDRRQAQGAGFTRLPQDRFFTDFSFGMVGAKDEKGNFLHRDRFYSLKPEVQAEYTRRVRDYVVKLAEDLGVRRK